MNENGQDLNVINYLNNDQKEAVLDESDACLVNANVGSGKTTVLIAKIEYLHLIKKVPLESMVVLTFTNKAADEIKERLIKKGLCGEGDRTLWFGTFHGVALSMLKTILPVENLGYTADFLVMLPEEELELAQHLISEQKLKIKYKNRLKKRIEQARSTTKHQSGNKYEDDFDRMLELLQKEKIMQNKMTYHDLLANACNLLAQNPEVVPCKWVIVDEVQDCDNIQLDFLNCLKSEAAGAHLFAVGDPNQVIYSWRGSAFQVFYALRNQYHARELSLSVNYRSSGTILQASRRFLQNGGKLEGVKESGNKIVIKNHYDAFSEADYLVGKINQLHDDGVHYKDIAVFYRLQNQSETLEHVFDRNNIPYMTSIKRSIQDVPVLNWFLCVLRFCVNHNDTASAIQVLCDRQYGEGWTQKKAVKRLEELGAGVDAGSCEDLLHSMWDFEGNISAMTADRADVDKEILGLLHLEQYISPTSATYQADMENIRKLLGLMHEFFERSRTNSVINDIQNFLNQAALYGMELDSDQNQDSDTVKLMTLHASKGLEFSYVFITGVNHGLIPLHTTDFEAEDEERRLFFVGMTRAKEQLELSYYTSPDGYRVMSGPSRYLNMIPVELVEGDVQRDPAKTDVEYLQKLKRQIIAERENIDWKTDCEAEIQSVNHENDERADAESIEKTSSDAKVIHEELRVRHQKYGTGTVLREDDLVIVVAFDDYGEKELMKGFVQIERL